MNPCTIPLRPLVRPLSGHEQRCIQELNELCMTPTHMRAQTNPWSGAPWPTPGIPVAPVVAPVLVSNWLLTPFIDSFSGTVSSAGLAYNHTFPGQPSGQLVMVLIPAADTNDTPVGSNYDFSGTTGDTAHNNSSGGSLPPPASRLGRLDTPPTASAAQSAWFYCPPNVDLSLSVIVLGTSAPGDFIIGSITAWRLTHVGSAQTFTVHALTQNFVTDEDFQSDVPSPHVSSITSDGGIEPTLDWYLGSADGSSLSSTGEPAELTDLLIVPSSYSAHYLNVARVDEAGAIKAYSTTATPGSRAFPGSGDYDFEADVMTFELTLSP